MSPDISTPALVPPPTVGSPPIQANLPLGRSLPTGAPERTWIYIPAGMHLHDVEQFYIRATLELHGGDRRKAAAALGISLKTLYNRLPARPAGEKA